MRPPDIRPNPAPGSPRAERYDGVVASIGRVFREHVENFFTNWSTSDLPFGRKVALTVRNRAKSVVNKGCCGHHGQPGC